MIMSVHKEDMICLIGARGGSKRIPNKNLAQINGKPLIAYSILTAKELGLPVYVSTDSAKIVDACTNYKASTIIRPPELASDTSTDYDWINHSINKLKEFYGYMPDKIIFLRPTTPFREIEVLKSAISSFKEGFTSLRSVQLLKEAIEKTFRYENSKLHPAYPFYSDCNMIFKTEDVTNLPNQTFPSAYSGNGYIDIILPKTVAKGSLYGSNIQGFITERTLEIDEIDDLQYARYLYER